MLFISHDLSVVRYIADRVVVMYLGYIVEQGTTDQIFSPPYHPYTEALLSAIPIADTSVVKKHIVLEGDIPSAMNPPTGCPFQTRCRYKHLVPDGSCEKEVPPLRELGEGHRSLCWLPDEVLATMEPVISFDKGGEPHAHDIVPEDAGTPRPFGTQPRPVAPPKRKRATPAAGALAGEIIEADEAALAAASDPDTVTAPDPGGGRFAGAVLPAEPIAEVGDGRQALDPLVPPAGAAAPPPLDRPADADDLQLIAGIGPAIERQLNELGVLTLAQIAAWTDAERDYIDRQLRFRGRIDREQWIRQAEVLVAGGEAEYIRVFGKPPR